MTFAYGAEVDGFGPPRRSDESEELRFFGRESLGGSDVIETSGPVLDAYLDPVTRTLPEIAVWDTQSSRVPNNPQEAEN
jgi:hypothetical protein